MAANYIDVLTPIPGNVNLGPLNDFDVKVKVNTVAPYSCNNCWAVAYLESEGAPPNAMSYQALTETATTSTSSTWEGTLTLNGCGEKFGIVATAELSDGTGVDSYLTYDTGLKYFGVCSKIMKKPPRKPARAKKSKASKRSQDLRTVAKKKAAGAARKSQKSSTRRKATKK